MEQKEQAIAEQIVLERAQDQAIENDIEKILTDFEVITADDEQLYLEHRDQGKVRLTEMNANILRPGGLLELKYFNLWHMVIVENVRTQPNRSPGCVIIDTIHYGRPDILTPNRIIRETFERNLNTEECWLHVLLPSSCYPPATVLHRARSRLNQEQHSPLSNNASQFAFWCKTQSPTHRPDSLVPIYLSDKHHTHEVKIGDHLIAKCDGDKSIHTEVTSIDAWEDRIIVTAIVREDDVKASSIPFVHETQQRIEDKEVSLLISAESGISLADLNSRIQLLNKQAYKTKVSSLSICLLLTDPNIKDVSLTRVVNPQSIYKHYPLCKKTNPRTLMPGNIIYWQGVYRVVTQVSSDGSGTLVSTVQYAVGLVEDKMEPFELKFIIEKKEQDTMLCVHNDPVLDCHLYGGGRDKPSYTPVRVSDVREISKGDVISVHSSGVYSHLVVTNIYDMDDDMSPEDDSPRLKASLDVLSYVLNPSFSTKQFQIVLRRLDVDLNKSEVHLIKYNVRDDQRYSEEDVIARAFSRQGEQDHNLLWNNGRDFARWCSIKHPSNREQCQVPIISVAQLLEFKQGHVKFLKFLDLYTHDAILRDCSSVEGCDDIVRVQLYENNHVFRTVRVEDLQLSQDEVVRRWNYDGYEPTVLKDLDTLMKCTFLNANDDKKGWTAMPSKNGSRVTSQDFCYWLKTLKMHEGLPDVQKLFGSHLENMQTELVELQRDGVLIFQSRPSSMIRVDHKVDKSSIRRLDHVILTRKVRGKDEEVHFILTEWDPESGTGKGVTYELPPEKASMGFKEFNGFLRITGPGQMVKVVHNSELNWETIDTKFLECQGVNRYDLLMNNCEHFVNFLIYGRFTSLQISDLALTASNMCPTLALQFARGVGRFSQITSRIIQIFADVTPSVPDGNTLWAEGVGLALVLVFSALEAALLEWRNANTAMSNVELKQRRRCIVSTLVSSIIGLGVSLSLSVPSLMTLFGVSLAACFVGWTAPKIPAILEATRMP